MVQATTHNVTVAVETRYLEDDSDPGFLGEGIFFDCLRQLRSDSPLICAIQMIHQSVAIITTRFRRRGAVLPEEELLHNRCLLSPN